MECFFIMFADDTKLGGTVSVFKGRAATQKPYKIQGHVQSPAPGREVHLAVTHAGDCLAEKWPWALHKTIN